MNYQYEFIKRNKDQNKFRQEHPEDIDIDVYAVGRKIAEAAVKSGLSLKADLSDMADKPSYEDATDLASALTDSFISGETGHIILLYSHFATAASSLWSVKTIYLLHFTTSTPELTLWTISLNRIRPHHSHADSLRQCREPNRRTHTGLQQRPPTGDHSQNSGSRRRHYGLILLYDSDSFIGRTRPSQRFTCL